MNLRSFSILQIALGASIAVHATLLAVRFVDPAGFERVFKDMPMEVILVNAKSNEPENPYSAEEWRHWRRAARWAARKLGV